MIDLSAFLTVAVRAWTEPVPEPKATKPDPKRPKSRRRRPHVQHFLVFDTETTIDVAQGLLFGCFRYLKLEGTNVVTVAEGLIYADDIPETNRRGYRLLQEYVRSYKGDIDPTYLSAEPNWELLLVSRREFTRRWLWHVGYPHNHRRDPAAIVCFNFPFDISRIAVEVTDARDDMKGGFSFTVFDDGNGGRMGWRPDVSIKNLDSKRALKKFRKRERRASDFTGHLLDLRTLVFALTGESHTLDSACARFGVEGKATTPDLGDITIEAIDYCRQDVRATSDLLQTVLVEYDRHPIALQPTQAYSPASIAKSYLDAMGIQPRREQQPDFSPEICGYCMSAFYGGRAEVKIRSIPVPVRLLDFTSMYPTVNVLMGVWEFVIAERIECVDAANEVQQMLDKVTLDDCLERGLWRDLVVVAEVVPDGDVLPVRANYRPQDWSIGVNYLHSDRSHWYTLADLLAAKLHTGWTPQILRAYRFVPVGRQSALRSVNLRGELRVDPVNQDFFRKVVEIRQQLKTATHRHPEQGPCQQCETAAFLKVLANAGSYGIYAEMVRQEQPAKVVVHNSTGQAFTTKVANPERPGRYCFPSIAACITGAARLMLTLLERTITDKGGHWALCDTDSLAIVATERGDELFACPGGPERLSDGTPAIRALSWARVDELRHRFNQLNPYDTHLVPHILKVDATGICLAISAKRYVIYDRTPLGRIEIIKRSEHGLGRYLPPRTMPTGEVDENAREAWVDDCWRWIIAANDNPDEPLPSWADTPALTRITVSSPLLARPFTGWNWGKAWDQRIKPFNFLLVADLDPFGLPPGADPHRFRLITAYDTEHDGRDLTWRNLYDPGGPTYRVTTDRWATPHEARAVIKSYGQVLREYRLHPEYKFDGPDRAPCSRATRGLLQRRTVWAAELRHIGKEANRLDDVRGGVVAAYGEVTTTYGTLDEWRGLVMPILASLSGRELAARTGLNRRTVDRIRQGQEPRADARSQLLSVAYEIAKTSLRRSLPPDSQHLGVSLTDTTAVLAAWKHDRHPTL